MRRSARCSRPARARWARRPTRGRQDDGSTIITQHNVAGIERELGRLDVAEGLGSEALEAIDRNSERYLAGFYAAWNAAAPDATRATKAAEWQAKVDAAR